MENEKPRRPLYYADYIHLDQLLGSQQLQSALHGRPAHDEMLFIIVHQAYELWFKQILWELDAVLATFEALPSRRRSSGKRSCKLGRIVEIQRVLIQQVDVLETMTRLPRFPDDLIPASPERSISPGREQAGNAARRSPSGPGSLHVALSEEDAARVEASEKEPSSSI